MGKVRKPMAGDIYRHFKDKLYEIITIAIHSETEEEMVVYKQMYGTFETYVRPLSMFLSEVDHEKYPNVKQKYRFERIGALKREDDEEEIVQKAPMKSKVEKKEEHKEEYNVLEKISKQEAYEQIKGVDSNLEAKNVIIEKVTTEQEDSKVEEQSNLEADENLSFLMRFLDARTYGEKLVVLEDITRELDDRTINNMAISMDLVIEEGTPEERLEELRDCIRTKAKYEYFRLR